jgi:hypothetical protein
MILTSRATTVADGLRRAATATKDLKIDDPRIMPWLPEKNDLKHTAGRN